MIQEYNGSNQFDKLFEICVEMMAKEFGSICSENLYPQDISVLTLDIVSLILQHPKLIATHRNVNISSSFLIHCKYHQSHTYHIEKNYDSNDEHHDNDNDNDDGDSCGDNEDEHNTRVY